MKTRGPTHWEHMYAWSVTHALDAEKQRIQKGGRIGRKVRRKYERIARNVARKLAVKEGDHVAANPSTFALRFPEFWGGFEIRRTNLACVWHEGVPPPGLYEVFGKHEGDELSLWTELVGGYHSGYTTGKGVQFFKTADHVQRGVRHDYRFHHETVTLPEWDTKALEAAVGAGEIPQTALVEIALDFVRWAERDGVKFASCGAAKELILCGLSAHLEDGSIHLHPIFTKTSQLLYRRCDGTLQPRQLAPLGRHRKGEGWVGGERLGLVSATGKLVTNPLGPAECAADAMREAGMRPPADHGKTWGFLDTVIDRRVSGGYFRSSSQGEKIWVPDGGVTRGSDGRGIGTLPFDLEASRKLRQLVAELAARVPAFKMRRDSELATARQTQEKLHQEMVRALAGDVLDEKDREIRSRTRLLKEVADHVRDIRERMQAEAKTKSDSEAILKSQRDHATADANAQFNKRAALAEMVLRRAGVGLELSLNTSNPDMSGYMDVLFERGGQYFLRPEIESEARELEGHPACPSAYDILILNAVAAESGKEGSRMPEYGRRK